MKYHSSTTGNKDKLQIRWRRILQPMFDQVVLTRFWDKTSSNRARVIMWIVAVLLRCWSFVRKPSVLEHSQSVSQSVTLLSCQNSSSRPQMVHLSGTLLPHARTLQILVIPCLSSKFVSIKFGTWKNRPKTRHRVLSHLQTPRLRQFEIRRAAGSILANLLSFLIHCTIETKR